MHKGKTSLFFVILLLGLSCWARDTNVVMSDQDRQKALNGPLSSLDFQEKMDVVSNSTRVSYDKSLFLVNGMMSYPVRYQLIDSAKKSILISTFSIYGTNKKGKLNQKSTRIMIDKIAAAVKRGVEVKIITDGGSSLLGKSDDALDALRDTGATLYKYNPIVNQYDDAPYSLAILPILKKMIAGQAPLNNRWHEKSMVVDGKYLLIGGLNWGDIYAYGNAFSAQIYSPENFYNHPLAQEIGLKQKSSWPKIIDSGWRDTDLLLSGEIAAEVGTRLLKDMILFELINERGKSKWPNYVDVAQRDYDFVNEFFDVAYRDHETYFEEFYSQHEANVRYIAQRPYLDRKLKKTHKQLRQYAKNNDLFVDDKNPSLYISNFYINTIRNAQKQIIWGCHSSRPPEIVLRELRKAARRGVKIYLLGNSKESSKTLPDKGILMYRGAFCHYRDLMQDQPNIRIFEYKGSEIIRGQEFVSGAFHSKLFSVDGIITSIGSYNISKASYQKHTEGTAVILDTEFAKEAEQIYQNDLMFSQEVLLDDLLDDDCAPPANEE